MSERERGGRPEIIEALRGEISRDGRVTFARFMELALYHPEAGYYLQPERRPGRGGDFLTAPEASPFFGLTLSTQMADCWERLGQPKRFTIREHGAGVGGLAYDILAGLADGAPDCFAAVDYRLVEANPHRVAQALEAFAEVGLAEKVTAEPANATLDPIVGVVLANEVADALPVHRLVVTDDGLREGYVTWHDGWFAEALGEPTPEGLVAHGELLAAGVTVPVGSRLDVSPAAEAWFFKACRGIERGYAFVIDYGYPAATLFSDHRLDGTVRAYHGHTVSDDPLARPGDEDLTAHVDFSALQRAGEAVGMRHLGFTNQGDFLAALGLGQRFVALQQDSATNIADYYAAQSAVFRLIEPGGLGRFGVLVMGRGVEGGVLGLG